MNELSLEAAIEAALFASGSPVTPDKLSEIFELEKSVIADAVAGLAKRLAEPESGIELITVDGAYQLCTKACNAVFVKKALELRKTPPLTKASLEVLAIICYNQPVTKSFIESVRGVDSDGTVNSLSDKGLVKECGHLDAPGKPTLFAVTDNFLRCFGLESLNDLPHVDVDGQQTLLTEEPAQTDTASASDDSAQ